ncbi:MAG: CAP domain-containing protein [Caldisericales bacterium]|nr:CAP domain-containing protein [bacterium]
MKRSVAVGIAIFISFFAVNVLALPSNTLKFTLGEKSVSFGEESAEMNVPLFKIGDEHFVSMEFLAKHLKGASMQLDGNNVSFSVGETTENPGTGEEDGEELLDIMTSLHEKINKHRAEVGAPPLEISMPATFAAQDHTTDMCIRGFFDHTNPDGLKPGDRLSNYGVKWSKYGENIQKLTMVDGIASKIDENFQNSPNHKKNRLDKDFTHIGIGLYKCGNEMFVTELFFTPREQTKPADKGELKFFDATYWKISESGDSSKIVACFKNTGKTNLTNVTIMFSVLDSKEEVIATKILSFYGILEQGQYFTDSFTTEGGIAIPDDAKVSYKIEFEETGESNPKVETIESGIEKGKDFVAAKGKITNKSSEKSFLFVIPTFLSEDGKNLRIADYGICEIESFEPGKTYDYTALSEGTPDFVSKHVSKTDYSYWFIPRENLSMTHNMEKVNGWKMPYQKFFKNSLKTAYLKNSLAK